MGDRVSVAVVTTTRADYHILRPLIEDLDNDPAFDLDLIVTGTHHSPEHGSTVDIVRSAIDPITEIDAGFRSSDVIELVRSCGVLGTELAEHLRAARPNVLLLLGDRFELLTVAQVALLLGIPIAHVHGGEITRGAIDDSVRNALTQVADVHLVAATEFADRVLQLGADPTSVHIVGALGVDAALRGHSQDRSDALSSIGLPDIPYVVVALHPETRGSATVDQLFQAVAGALEGFPDLGVVVTAPNTDPGGDELSMLLRQWAERRDRACFVASLGVDFPTVAAHAVAIIGNSSSGIIEAPALMTATVDIGDRQLGRPRSSSVLHVGPSVDPVRDAISQVCDGLVSFSDMPYGRSGSVDRVREALLRVPHMTRIAER